MNPLIRRCSIYIEYILFCIIFVTNISACQVQQTTRSSDPSTNTPQPKAADPTAAAQKSQDTFSVLAGRITTGDLKFNRFSVEQGLSQSTVRSIIQDRNGYLWFGTEDGLNRFDGYTFYHYKHNPDDPDSLSSNNINCLFQDQRGYWWIGTNGGGLNRLDPSTGKFSHYTKDTLKPDTLRSDIITAIIEGKDASLWVGTMGGGLSLLDIQTGSFTNYRNELNNPGSLISNDVLSLALDNQGKVWIGTNKGVDQFDPETNLFTHYTALPGEANSLSDAVAASLSVDEAGAIWIGTRIGILEHLDPKSGKFTHFAIPKLEWFKNEPPVITTILPASPEKLWLGSNNSGLALFDKAKSSFTFVRNDSFEPHSLSSNCVISLFLDLAGSLWIGTYGGGVNQLDWSSNRFRHIRHQPAKPGSLKNNLVWAILKDRSGSLWVGSEGGLDHQDPATGIFHHFTNDPSDPSSLSSDSVRAIYQDSSGTIWIGTPKGLDKFNPASMSFDHYLLASDDNPSSEKSGVMHITEDHDGYLWIASDKNGIYNFEKTTGSFVNYRYDPLEIPSLSSNKVWTIVVDQSNNLWIGTTNGLDYLNQSTNQISHFRHKPEDTNSLADNNVLSILQDFQGMIWIGTTRGLDRYDPSRQTFTHFQEKDGLPNPYVYGIVQDDQGNLWISTNKGLARLGRLSEQFKVYEVNDGLQSNEFNSGAYARSEDGEVFFGGINGVTAFYPDDIHDNPVIPPLVFTNLTQSGSPAAGFSTLSPITQVVFHWPNNFFEFEFAALSFSQAEQNQYAYMLENFDQNWVMIGRRRNGRYTNLPGGEYTLRIKGTNNDGLWNENGAALMVRIIPPLWQENWFRITSIILIGSVIALGYRWRLRNIQEHNQRLAAQVSERTAEIEQRRQVADGLREILLLINSDRSLEESLGFIANQARRLSGARCVCLVEIANTKESRWIAVSTNDAELGEAYSSQELLQLCVSRLEHLRSLPGDELRTGILAQPEQFLLDHGSSSTTIVLPIAQAEEFFGGMVVHYRGLKKFSTEELDLLNSICDQAALAAGNARLRSRAEALAVIAERNRLARDLHDAVTQTLFSASLIAEALPAIWESDPAEGRQLLGELRQLNRGALAEMRSLLMELRPTAVIDARMPDLLNQLSEAVVGRTSIRVTLDIQDHQVDLPEEVHMGLYRIAQEALTNVVRHAHATCITLRLHTDIGTLENAVNNGVECLVKLEISDDGCGFDPATVPCDHFGLLNLRERAQSIGADLQIESLPGKGTSIRAFWKGKAIKHG